MMTYTISEVELNNLDSESLLETLEYTIKELIPTEGYPEDTYRIRSKHKSYDVLLAPADYTKTSYRAYCPKLGFSYTAVYSYEALQAVEKIIEQTLNASKELKNIIKNLGFQLQHSGYVDGDVVVLPHPGDSEIIFYIEPTYMLKPITIVENDDPDPIKDGYKFTIWDAKNHQVLGHLTMPDLFLAFQHALAISQTVYTRVS